MSQLSPTSDCCSYNTGLIKLISCERQQVIAQAMYVCTDNTHTCTAPKGLRHLRADNKAVPLLLVLLAKC